MFLTLCYPCDPQDRLYYIALNVAPSNVTKNGIRNGRQMHWFQIDTELLYWNFFRDFGPLNLGQLYRFCTKLNNLLDTKPNQTIVFYSSSDQAKRANATYLICAWQLLYMNRTPEEAQRGFQLTKEQIDGPNLNASAPPENINSFTVQALNPFHDASPCNCTYDLTVLDCLRGLVKARMYGFFDFSTFRVEEYEHYEQVEVSRTA
jgi:cell division cycle 14